MSGFGANTLRRAIWVWNTTRMDLESPQLCSHTERLHLADSVEKLLGRFPSPKVRGRG